MYGSRLRSWEQVKIHACAQNFRETLEFLAPPHFWCSPCVTSPQNIVRTCIFAFSMIAMAKIRDYAQFSMAGALWGHVHFLLPLGGKGWEISSLYQSLSLAVLLWFPHPKILNPALVVLSPPCTSTFLLVLLFILLSGALDYEQSLFLLRDSWGKWTSEQARKCLLHWILCHIET